MAKQPLIVHIVFHPESTKASQLARVIHQSLNADPALPGLRIPTRFCPTDGISPPSDYELNEAERNLFVVLADAHIVDRDSEQPRKWCQFIGNLWEQCQGSPHRFLPVQLDEAAWGFDDRLNGTSFLRAFQHPAGVQCETEVVRRIAIELCRFLQGMDQQNDAPAPLTLFLSHTKLDLDTPPFVTRALINHLKHDQPVNAWCDSGDIEAGSRFAEAIEAGINDSSLLCVLTNHYASREWCRREILLAKQQQRPIVVIGAGNRNEIRSFPYLGNVPLVSWPVVVPEKPGKKAKKREKRLQKQQENLNCATATAAVDLLIKETLRHLYTRQQLKQAQKEGDILSTRPPELLSLLGVKPGQTVLYPDPPLGEEEQALLRQTAVTTTTPLARLAAHRPLSGQKIALSMSESSDIQRHGFGPIHLEGAIIELSRYLLIQGATLVYGGHLGNEGYTQQLFELVRSYHNVPGITPVERIINTVGWPLPYSQELIAKFSQEAQLQRIDYSADLEQYPGLEYVKALEQKPFDTPDSLEKRYCWARGMTRMREVQTTDKSAIQARLILGGKFGPSENGPGSDEKWYQGKMPGVLEEILLSIEAGHPLFLIGAFGGAAQLAIDLIEGRDRPEASWAYQRRAPFAEALRDKYRERGIPWTEYPVLIQRLRDAGVAGINPLLSEAQNRELFHSRDLSRILELVMTGLGNFDKET
ncbi:MAG: TIR domain-containing protein [Candidatus Sedimenticola sp. (ex Thyasira tokunagai)]